MDVPNGQNYLINHGYIDTKFNAGMIFTIIMGTSSYTDYQAVIIDVGSRFYTQYQKYLNLEGKPITESIYNLIKS
tara:strand:- start:255 stop:479 length:225 start_codon:yes stop_codon:yes gene_type:complete